MIVVKNILYLPLILAIYAVDTYLLLAAIRLAMDRFNNRFIDALRQVVDPVPQRVIAWLATRGVRPVRRWAVWLLVFVALIVLRHLLLWVVI